MENPKCPSAKLMLSGLTLHKDFFIPSPKLFFHKSITSLLPKSQENAVQGQLHSRELEKTNF